MEDKSSDVCEDSGRKESERYLAEMSSKYLAEVMEKNDVEYEEAVELIEREKAARSVLHLRDQHELRAMADAAPYISEAAGYDVPFNFELRPNGYTHAVNVGSMPSRPMTTSNEGGDYAKARNDDKNRVKDEVAAGKRVADGDAAREAVKGMQKGVKKVTKGMQ